MTTTPAEHHLPPVRGRALFAVLGGVVRAVKALPEPLRERLLGAATGGASAALPPFPDVLRLVEAAGGVPDGRRWQERLLADRPDLREVRTRDVTDDSHGRVRARLYLPPEGAPTATAAFVWVHGGAFVLGSLDQKEAHWPAVELAASGIPVLSVDYRLCLRGVRFPVPQDDVIDAWRWAQTHADQLGVAPEQLHLGGGSAGACLAASTTLRLRADGEPMPASVFLGYPVLEGDLPAASPTMAQGLGSSKVPADAWIHAMFANWAGPAPWTDPQVSPGRADLAGLPPTFVLTCGRDALRRSSEPYVQRLRDAGVDVQHELLQESEHAPLDRPGTSDGERAIALLRDWLRSGTADSATQDDVLPSPP